MGPANARRAFALAATLAFASGQFAVLAAPGDAVADLVVGQPNSTSHTPNAGGVSASGLSYPTGAALDADGNLYVADYANNRVLGYLSPFTTDLVADVVIGQPDFNSGAYNNGGVSASSLGSPNDVAIGPNGDLWVVDGGNNRVLEYDRPFENDAVADFVIGQPNFGTSSGNDQAADAGSLYFPTDVAVDAAGNVWVADGSNHRVLRYDRPLETLDRLADLVIGQPTLTDHGHDDAVVDAKTFLNPNSVAVDAAGTVWVVDLQRNRVLGFDDPAGTDAVADRVLGQPSLGTRDPNYTGSVDAAGLWRPSSVAADVNGNVYVTDTFNNRVLMYRAPRATSDRIADRVFGQLDFNSNEPNTGGVSARTLQTPLGVCAGPTGDVAVADYDNHRVTLLATPTPLLTSVQVKVSPATGKAKLVVAGLGLASGRAVVEVNGAPLGATKYKLPGQDGAARRLVGLDPNFDARVPRGVRVQVTVYDPQTGGRSAPAPLTR